MAGGQRGLARAVPASRRMDKRNWTIATSRVTFVHALAEQVEDPMIGDVTHVASDQARAPSHNAEMSS
jgi:hypothetical protein